MVFEASVMKREMGEQDSELLFPLLHTLFVRHRDDNDVRFRLLIDIGANVGRTSRTLMDTFSDVACHDLVNAGAVGHLKCRPEATSPRVVAFEPIPTNFELMVNHATRCHWTEAGWSGLLAAVGDSTHNVTFYTSGSAGDEQA